MEQFFLYFCTALQINTAACNSALLGIYTNSNIQKEYNASKSYSEGRVNHYIQDNKAIVYSGTALYTGYDMYKKKQVKISTPLNPICDFIDLDLRTDNDDSVQMNWKWSF